MKLIINISNIVVGGGIQVSLSFLEALKSHPDNKYHVFLSPAVDKQLNLTSFSENFEFYYIPITPAKIKSGSRIRKQLSNLEKEIRPDLVFTVFGPAYWTPKSLHVSGYANGWCYNPDSIAFDRIGFLEKFISRFSIPLRNYLVKKSDYLIVETNVAKKNIVKYLEYTESRIFVVGNTYHQVYNKNIKSSNRADSDVFKLLVLSSLYPNKNLEVINDVVKKLRSKSDTKFLFQLTLSDDVFKRNFISDSYIKNIGPQNIEYCPQLYKNSDALFLPTLLETFTANYPEAMKMETPILTSNLDFARELCGDAALYFNPLSAEDIANRIIELQSDKTLQETLIHNGKERLKTFETSESRAIKYLTLFKRVLRDK